MFIYHIASRARWSVASETGEYRTDSLEAEGFVHCSTRRQLAETANRHFAGQKDLVSLRLDPRAIGAEIRHERLGAATEAYPHVYGPIPLSAVVEVVELPVRADGSIVVPESV